MSKLKGVKSQKRAQGRAGQAFLPLFSKAAASASGGEFSRRVKRTGWWK